MTTRVAIFGVLVLTFACGAPRRSDPIAGPPELDPKEQRGEIAFMRVCNACHPGGEGGLGGSLTKTMPGVYIRQKVRVGFGSDMPTFDDKTLSDEELDDVIAYIEKRRQSR